MQVVQTESELYRCIIQKRQRARNKRAQGHRTRKLTQCNTNDYMTRLDQIPIRDWKQEEKESQAHAINNKETDRKQI